MPLERWHSIRARKPKVYQTTGKLPAGPRSDSHPVPSDTSGIDRGVGEGGKLPSGAGPRSAGSEQTGGRAERGVRGGGLGGVVGGRVAAHHGRGGVAEDDLPPIVVPVVKLGLGRSGLPGGWGGRISSASGAGGREPRALWGRTGLSSRRQRAMRIWASGRGVKISGLRPASRSVPVQDFRYPFSQGLPGAMTRVVTPSRCS